MTISIYIKDTFRLSLFCRLAVITTHSFISWAITVTVSGYVILKYDRFILIASWEILKFWLN